MNRPSLRIRFLRWRASRAIAAYCEAASEYEDPKAVDAALDRALAFANRLSALGDCSYQPPFAGAYCGHHKAFADEGRCVYVT